MTPENFKHTEETKKKLSEAARLRWENPVFRDKMKQSLVWSDECKKKRSEAQKGKRHSLSAKKKMSEAAKLRWQSKEYRENYSKKRSGMKRQPHSEDTKIKISKSHIGYKFSTSAIQNMKLAAKKRWENKEYRDKSITERKNRDWSAIRDKLAAGGKKSAGHIVSVEARIRIGEKNRKNMLGKKHSSETKRKMRIGAIRRIQRLTGNQVYPNWNIKACDYFDKFDQEHQTKGQYATNGGERYIPHLGYWVDYINDDLKIIVEWDESRHYNFDGTLKEKDQLRQEEIQGVFPNYKFIRIKE